VGTIVQGPAHVLKDGKNRGGAGIGNPLLQAILRWISGFLATVLVALGRVCGLFLAVLGRDFLNFRPDTVTDVGKSQNATVRTRARLPNPGGPNDTVFVAPCYMAFLGSILDRRRDKL